MGSAVQPSVGLVVAGADSAMLAEWVAAAGFDPVRVGGDAAHGQLEVCATLVRWPVDVSLAELPQPVILMYEQGAELGGVVGSVANTLELPDRREVSSLLAWSSQLGEMLWGFAREHSAALVSSGGAEVSPPAGVVASVPIAAPVDLAARVRGRPRVIVLGVSTGGPASLRVFFDGLSDAGDLPPIVIVQHIPPTYVKDLVERLSHQTGYDVRVADDNTRLRPGVAYMAPGDVHVRLRPCAEDLYVSWDDQPPIRGHCPAVDVLFDSCRRLDGHGVALMMTGMGRDGATPMLALRRRGWATVGQDEATCTIYGMPAAAKEAGAIERELSLSQIAPWLVSYCRRTR